jgi:transposase
MWTQDNRGRYDRSQLCYPSDLSDEEWAHVEPLIPAAKRGGNKRHVNVREVVNALMYVLSTGCQWRAIPKDLPPRSASIFEKAVRRRRLSRKEIPEQSEEGVAILDDRNSQALR